MNELNKMHTAIAEGKVTEIRAIESMSVDEYYSYLQANHARCEDIKREMDKMKGK